MSLLESIAALAVEATVVIGLTATLTTVATVADGIGELRRTRMDARRVEQLLDHAVARAGAGPTSPHALLYAEPLRVVLQSDADGNGTIDSRTSELIEFVLRHDGNTQRLVHRIGRQSMTLVRGVPADARMLFRRADGRPTSDPRAVRSISIPVGVTHYTAALRPRDP